MWKTSVHLFHIRTVWNDSCGCAKGTENLAFELAEASSHVAYIPECERLKVRIFQYEGEGAAP